MPFTHIELKALIPKPYDFVPISLGDHIRKKRLEMGLLQREAAEKLGVNVWTVLNWEKSHTEPPIMAMPAIFRFLGYVPYSPPRSVAERLLAKRREMGLSIREAAKKVGVDPGTWSKWERGKTILRVEHRAQVVQFLIMPTEDLSKEMSRR